MRNTLIRRRWKDLPERRTAALAQVTWFAFILGGTLALGTVGLVWGLR